MTTTEGTVTHATFTIERLYKSSPARVFAAWADKDAKSQWFTGGPNFKEQERAFDFCVGGRDALAGVWQGEDSADCHSSGTTTRYEARYEEILQDQRLIFTYRMEIDDAPISVSLATVQFQSEGTGTRLVFTEQLTFLDGYDDADARDRERGTNVHLDRLEAYLDR